MKHKTSGRWRRWIAHPAALPVRLVVIVAALMAETPPAMWRFLHHEQWRRIATAAREMAAWVVTGRYPPG